MRKKAPDVSYLSRTYHRTDESIGFKVNTVSNEAQLLAVYFSLLSYTTPLVTPRGNLLLVFLGGRSALAALISV